MDSKMGQAVNLEASENKKRRRVLSAAEKCGLQLSVSLTFEDIGLYFDSFGSRLACP